MKGPGGREVWGSPHMRNTRGLHYGGGKGVVEWSRLSYLDGRIDRSDK